MFSTIDARLIDATQWCVRQLELLTSITREDILSFMLKIQKWFVLGWYTFCSVFSYMTTEVSSSLQEVSVFFNFVYVAILFATYKIDFARVTDQNIGTNGVKPKEIVTLFSHRRFAICVTIFLTVIFTIPYERGAFTESLLLSTFTALTSICYSKVILYYILCTTSLPPGEKQRRKQEKEMQNMVPAAM
jgi:hypothetical protein